MLKTRIIFGLMVLLLIKGMAPVHAASYPDFTGIVEQYAPAVVNISTTQKVSGMQGHEFMIPGLPDDHEFGELFKKFFEYQERFGGPDSFDEQSLGSGVIISPDGYILTNVHVIGNADQILVRLHDRRELEAEVIGTDEQTDLALIKIQANNLPTVKMGSSRDLKVGEWVLAIGTPFGFDHTATAGIVSAKGRNFQNENYVPFIQTDVAINPGNSGGPLFNTRGEVVGINSRISSEPGRRSYAGLSFAIPAEVAWDVMQQLKTHGQVSRGWLGVLIQDVTPELSHSFGLDRPRGALVAKVIGDSPAEKSDVQVGDVILKFNNHNIRTSSELPPLVGSLRAGEVVRLGILRDGQQRIVQVKIGELPEDALSSRTFKKRERSVKVEKLGIKLRDLDETTSSKAGVDHGVLVVDVGEGPAKEIGLRSDDIIQMLDNQKVESVAGLQRVLQKIQPGRSVAILVYRDTGPVFLAMRMP